MIPVSCLQSVNNNSAESGNEMIAQRKEKIQARIESLTVNLLECYEELDLIHRVSLGLMSTLDIEAMSNFILTEALETFEADVGWLFLAATKDFPEEIHKVMIDQETILAIDSYAIKNLIKNNLNP